MITLRVVLRRVDSGREFSSPSFQHPLNQSYGLECGYELGEIVGAGGDSRCGMIQPLHSHADPCRDSCDYRHALTHIRHATLRALIQLRSIHSACTGAHP